MKKIRCIIVDDEPVARSILESHLSNFKHIELVCSCKNALEAFNQISTEQIDLVLLDINMPEISGLSFAKPINKSIKIIFTTAYREYAVDGFDLQAVDYLLKPISSERLLQAINKYLNENQVLQRTKSNIETLSKNDFIFVRADRKMMKIDFKEIHYIESLSDYIRIFLNDRTVVTRENISNIEAKLPKDEFIRTHRSFIVAISHIVSFTSETIETHSKEIPISRSYKNEVLMKLEDL